MAYLRLTASSIPDSNPQVFSDSNTGKFSVISQARGTVPLLPATATVAAPLRPELEPRKLSWPVCDEVMMVTLTARVVAPTLAELMLIAVNADVEPRPEVE